MILFKLCLNCYPRLAVSNMAQLYYMLYKHVMNDSPIPEELETLV